jgi:hypothetical protein
LKGNKITNFKHQITNKSQSASGGPMTKTLTAVVSQSFAKPGLPVMMLLSTSVDRSIVWHFEFRSLRFVF